MPKMKNHGGAAKRFCFTATGKVKFKRAKMRHIQFSKTKDMKRKARHAGIMVDADARHVHVLLPHK